MEEGQILLQIGDDRQGLVLKVPSTDLIELYTPTQVSNAVRSLLGDRAAADVLDRLRQIPAA